MAYDNDLIAGKLRRWEKYLERYRLPAWEEIPDFGLYMEQVVQLLKQYLSYLPPELKQSQTITAAAINNYVRTKMLPEPRKKKYYRIHIAYLLMICTLKQSLSLSMLQTLLPGDLPEDEVKRAYTAYDAVVAFIFIGERHPVLDRPHIRAERKIAGGLDAGKYDFFVGSFFHDDSFLS